MSKLEAEKGTVLDTLTTDDLVGVPVIVAVCHTEDQGIRVFPWRGPEDFYRVCALVGDGKPFAYAQECKIEHFSSLPGLPETRTS